MPTVGAEVRGNCPVAVIRYLERSGQLELREKLVQSLGAERVARLHTYEMKDWCPVAEFNDPLRAIYDALPDKEHAKREMMRVGAQIASDSINSFMKLVIRMMTPALFSRKLPDIFAKDFRNTPAHVEIDTRQLDSGKAIYTFAQIGEMPYIAPAACGWVETGLTNIGCKDVKVWIDGDDFERQDYPIHATFTY